MLKALVDPGHEEHSRMREWAGELPSFDRPAADLLLRQTVGEVPGSVRLLLDLLAGGVKLTPGGRLPRSMVRQVQQRRPEWYPLGRPASIEEDLFPLAVLHEMLRGVGLLRLARGVLTPTRAAGDDLEIIRRLRSWFEPDGFDDILAGITVAVVSASGPIACAELADRVHPLLSPRWSVNGRPLATADVGSAINRQGAQLEALDLVGSDGGRAGRARRRGRCSPGRPPWRHCGHASRHGDPDGSAGADNTDIDVLQGPPDDRPAVLAAGTRVRPVHQAGHPLP